MIPAAQVKPAVGDEQAQFIGRCPGRCRWSGRRHRTGPVRWHVRPRRRCRPDAAPRPGGSGKSSTATRPAGSPPGCSGNADGGSSGKESTSVGTLLPMCDSLSRASSASSLSTRDTVAPSGAPPAATADRSTRRHWARGSNSVTPGRTTTSTLTPPGAWSGALLLDRAPRLELHDLVGGIGDAAVIHRQHLLDERLADAVEVTERAGRTRRTARR